MRIEMEQVVEGAAAGIHLATRALLERNPTPAGSSSDPSTTCEKGNTSPQCVTPAAKQSQQNLAVILGVV